MRLFGTLKSLLAAPRSLALVALATLGAPALASAQDVVLSGGSAGTRVGNWTIASDSGASSGSVVKNPDAGAAKITTALASPANYFEMSFDAVAGRAYRLWIRGRAQNDYWGNDSVFVQFSGSVTSSGSATYRIGTTSAAEVNLEDCSGCGISGWKWQDNGWGSGSPRADDLLCVLGHAADSCSDAGRRSLDRPDSSFAIDVPQCGADVDRGRRRSAPAPPALHQQAAPLKSRSTVPPRRRAWAAGRLRAMPPRAVDRPSVTLTPAPAS